MIESQRKTELDYATADDPDYRYKKIAGWYTPNKKWRVNCQNVTRSTMECLTLKHAGKDIKSFLVKSNSTLRILEIGAGNRVATALVTSEFIDCIDSLTTTDILNFDSQYSNIQFDVLNSVEAVKKYGRGVNTLLIIAPYPADLNDQESCSDYYACKDFISQTLTEGKLIIFIGELGASDGTCGMYLYLMDNPRLELLSRTPIHFYKHEMLGQVEKELFIFGITPGV